MLEIWFACNSERNYDNGQCFLMDFSIQKYDEFALSVVDRIVDVIVEAG